MKEGNTINILKESALMGAALLTLSINVANASMVTDARDPYTDGGHAMGKHDPYTGGEHTTRDIHTDGAHPMGTRDLYMDGDHR